MQEHNVILVDEPGDMPAPFQSMARAFADGQVPDGCLGLLADFLTIEGAHYLESRIMTHQLGSPAMLPDLLMVWHDVLLLKADGHVARRELVLSQDVCDSCWSASGLQREKLAQRTLDSMCIWQRPNPVFSLVQLVAAANWMTHLVNTSAAALPARQQCCPKRV